MKIVVLGGCGDMGNGVVQDLLAHTDAQVTIADYRIERAKKYADELGERVNAVFVDANDEASLVEVLRGADAAVGCIGPFYRFAPRLARAAVKAGVNYVDICDDYGPLDEVLAMHEDAKSAGVTLITGLGWTPGITNLMARDGALQLDEVDEIRVAWVGGAQDAEGLAVVKHVFYAITGDVPTYQNGQWTRVRAGTGKEVVRFPEPFGDIEVFHCGHPEPITIPRYFQVKTVSLKGALTPAWNNWLGDVFVRLGLTNTPTKIDRLSRLIWSLEGILGAGGIALSAARVDVFGRDRGIPRVLTYTAVDKMRRLTGIPAAIGAWMLAKGEIQRKGVFAPEGCLDSAAFFEALAQRGIQITKSST